MNQNMFNNVLEMAKRNNVASLQAAIKMYYDQNGNSLAHGIDDIDQLLPEYRSVYPGAPELLEHKSPIARVRTRQLDATSDDLRAKGYSNREAEKTLSGNLKALSRTTDPQTVYRKGVLHRDDINDIIDFDIVAYKWSIMRRKLEEEIARLEGVFSDPEFFKTRSSEAPGIQKQINLHKEEYETLYLRWEELESKRSN